MWGFGYFAILYGVMWIPMLVALTALGVVLVLRSVRAPSWFKGGATCGGCGYGLKGTTSDRCPECGGMLLRVGIITPRMMTRLRGGGYLLFMGWTLVVVGCATPIVGSIVWIGSMVQMNQWAQTGYAMASGPGMMSAVLVPTRTEEPTYHINMVADLVTDENDSIVSGTISLGLVHGESTSSVEILFPGETWLVLDADGAVAEEGSDFSTLTASSLYREAGLDVATNHAAFNEAVYLATSLETFIYSPEWDLPTLFGPAEHLTAENLQQDWTQSGPTQAVIGMTPGFGGDSSWDLGALAVACLAFVVYILGLIMLFQKRAGMIQASVAA
ncbi:MAG: hypothetical protein Phyf2KO_25430 [Phycisphaerales bacterium]